MNFTRANNLIPDCQIGYQPGMCTSDHILTLKTLIDRCLCKGPSKKLCCCFVDFRTAFPSICHPLLYYKLLKAGVGENVLKL